VQKANQLVICTLFCARMSEFKACLLIMLNTLLNVIHFERQVMQSFSSFGYEFGYGRIFLCGLQQLNLYPVYLKERGLYSLRFNLLYLIMSSPRPSNRANKAFA
jgi:hypothetical protein